MDASCRPSSFGMAVALTAMITIGCSDPPVQGTSGTDTSSTTGASTGPDATTASPDGSTSATTGGSTTAALDTTGSTTGDASTTRAGTTTAGATSPNARDDGPYLVASDQILQVDAAQGVLDNDDDPMGSMLEVVDADLFGSEGGVVSVAADGSFSYEPPVSLPFGTDRFAYVVRNEAGLEATAEVRVVVQPAAAIGLDALGSKGTRLQGVAPGDRSGHSASPAGDVDADGFHDLLVGAPGSSMAKAYLVRGSVGLPPVMDLAVVDTRFDAIAESDALGRAVSTGGDVDGDGFHDLLLGAPAISGPASPGAAHLVLGGPALAPVVDLMTTGIPMPGVSLFDEAGTSVDLAGDVNGDGFSDILVGAPSTFGMGSTGEAYLVYGGPSLPASFDLASPDVRFDGHLVDDLFGHRVRAAGDVNDDGFDDVLVGAPNASPNAQFPGDPAGIASAGQSYLVFGGPSLPAVIGADQADVRFDGIAPFDASGYVLDTAGDVDGDGHADVLVSAFLASPGGITQAGEVYLVRGGPSLPGVIDLAAADVRFVGVAPFDRAGLGLASAGDFDGDGFCDLLVGAPSSLGEGSPGHVYLVRGSDALPPVVDLATAPLQLMGVAPDDAAGMAVAAGGDVDGDGFDDVMVGAPVAAPGGIALAGESYLVTGDDLVGSVTALGGDGDDVLSATGGALPDRLIGGRGADILVSDGGPDVLRGGEGNDVLTVVDAAPFRLDGGLGEDTLALTGGLSLDLVPLGFHRIVEIERVLLDPTAPSSLTLSERHVVVLSSTTNTLTVDGDLDDTLVLATGTWSGPTPAGSHDRYASTTSAAVVRVAPEVTVMLP